jgi:branched-chain amino acid transport system permease protein
VLFGSSSPQGGEDDLRFTSGVGCTTEVDVLLSPQLLFSALVIGTLYSLIAVGLNMVYGTMRLLNIAHGDLIMLAAYAAFWFFTLTGLSPLLALPLVAAMTAAIGVLLYSTMFRGQLESGQSVARLEANSLLLFFGLSVIIQNVASLAFTASPRAYQYLDDVYHVAGVAMTGNRLTSIVISVIVLSAVLAFLKFTRFGLSIKALMAHREAAQIVGINIRGVQRLSFALGFGVAGVAGLLISMAEQISPFMGFPFTIAAFVVIILGGLGNIVGGIVAGLFLGFVEVYAVALTSANYRSIILYGLFVAILVLRPQGLLGKARTA